MYATADNTTFNEPDKRWLSQGERENAKAPVEGRKDDDIFESTVAASPPGEHARV